MADEKEFPDCLLPEGEFSNLKERLEAIKQLNLTLTDKTRCEMPGGFFVSIRQKEPKEETIIFEELPALEPMPEINDKIIETIVEAVEPPPIKQIKKRQQKKLVEKIVSEQIIEPVPLEETKKEEQIQQETMALVEQKIEPVQQPAPAQQDPVSAITITIGALAGAVSSAGTPALTNLVKSLLKNKLKGKNGTKQEEQKEEPTDCKTHQIKINAKIASMSSRIAALEGKNSGDFSLEDFDFEEISDRIKKLENEIKKNNKKGK
jgi:tetrahydromethanopterin S-methyltransferase subunit G